METFIIRVSDETEARTIANELAKQWRGSLAQFSYTGGQDYDPDGFYVLTFPEPPTPEETKCMVYFARGLHLGKEYYT